MLLFPAVHRRDALAEAFTGLLARNATVFRTLLAFFKEF